MTVDDLNLDDLLGDDGQPLIPRALTRLEIARANQKRSAHALFAPKVPEAAAESWWLGVPDRAAFRQRAAVEQARMLLSKFGRGPGQMTEPQG